MKTLETARLLLTPWREEDAEALYALASDPDIGPMCGWEPHRSVEDSRRIIRDVFSAPEVCAILSRESGTLLGAVGLQPPSEMFPELPATRQRELGYWLGRAYWGHRDHAGSGAGAAAVRLRGVEVGSRLVFPLRLEPPVQTGD